MTRKIQFRNSIINIIYEDHKKPKIIHKFQLEEAAMTLKFNIYIRVGLLYFWLILVDDLSWGQIDVWLKKILLESIQKGLVNDLKE